MSNIIWNILVAVFGLLISIPMNALVKRFCHEEKIFSEDFKKDMFFSTKMALTISFILIILFYVFGSSKQFFIYAFLSIILVMDWFCDMEAQIIPNGLNMVGFLVGSIYMYSKLVFNMNEGIDLLLGMFVGGGIFSLIALFALLVYRKEGMGLGDVKLMGMLGLFLGARNIFQVFVLSFFIGAVVSVVLLISKVKKMDDYIPFGPFIVIATLITMIFPYSFMLSCVEKLLS